MKPIYVFDVDGTLTPPRGVMDPTFNQWFLSFMSTHRVVLITGSDRAKTAEQIGNDLINKAEMYFACAGNVKYIADRVVYQHTDWDIPSDVERFLKRWLAISEYPTRCGCHIERRNGMVNFSVVGRNASVQQRHEYNKWDCVNNERLTIAKQLVAKWDDIQAVIGGEISIDILPVGKGKEQILDQLANEYIIFFGDKTNVWENDHEIVKRINRDEMGEVYSVGGWEHTWKILQRPENANA